jgi:hypothetical protein
MRHLRSFFFALACFSMLALSAMAATKAQMQCDNQWVKCWGNSGKCRNSALCDNRCTEKYLACENAANRHDSGGRSTKGTNPGGTRTGGTPPTRYPTNPTNGSLKSTGQLPTGLMIYRKK